MIGSVDEFIPQLIDRDISILDFQNKLADIILDMSTSDKDALQFSEIIMSNVIEFISFRYSLAEDKMKKLAYVRIIELILHRISKNLRYRLFKYAFDFKYIERIFHNIGLKKKITTGLAKPRIFDSKKGMFIREVKSDIEENHFEEECVEMIYDLSLPFKEDTIRVDPIFTCIKTIKKYVEDGTSNGKGKCEDDEESPIQTLDREGCILIRNPYESYDKVVRFIEDACDNDDLNSIFISLYRCAKDSRIIDALCKAARKGKGVFVYSEIQARGSELQNMLAIEKMKNAGIYIFTGYYSYKIHAKMCLVVMNDGRLYSHVGTGNYNEVTSKIYTDTQYLTASQTIGRELFYTFSAIIRGDRDAVDGGFIAKSSIRDVVLEKIDDEIKKGNEGRIWIKINNLWDRQVISKLVLAKAAGVDLRVICRSTIGSNTLKIKSKIGKYLEHDRLYIFGNNAYISSGDLLKRNMSKRIETFFKVPDYLSVISIINEFKHLWCNCSHTLIDGKWILESGY